MEKRRAIYPGSFDPVTFGHLDIIKRALLLFDELYVLIAINSEKDALFGIDERLHMMKKALGGLKGVKVETYGGLTVNYAKAKKAKTLIRGLRATSDFDYEFQMAITNRKLAPKIDTVFLMPSEAHFYISSRLIKEIAILGGDISTYVPSFISRMIMAKYHPQKARKKSSRT